MQYHKALMLTGTIFVLSCSIAFASDFVPTGNRIRVPMPRVKITDEYVAEHAGIKIPSYLKGQTLGIVAVSSSSTLAITDNGELIQIAGIITGNESQYESEYEIKKETWELLKTNPVKVPPFESLNIPAFRPFFGTYKSSGGSGGGFPYPKGSSGIDITGQTAWIKRGIRPGANGVLVSIYTIPIEFFNRTPKDIADFAPYIYLEDRQGHKYYPDPQNPKAVFPVPKLPARKQTTINVLIEAPADDFYLRPKVETKDHSLYLGIPVGPYDWESKALDKSYGYPTAQEIEQKLFECLSYASTKKGYARILANLSFLWLRTGRYDDSLAVIEKLLNTFYVNQPNISEEGLFIKRQRLVALIKSRQYKAAIAELREVDDKIVPADYREYLMRNCLRQAETEDIIEQAAQNPGKYASDLTDAKKRSQTLFDAEVIVTPYVADAQLLDRLERLDTLQGQYDEARARYADGQYADAKALLSKLADSPHGSTVTLGGNVFQVAPAVLDMLGRIYIRENNIPQAMESFKRMEAFPNDVFYGPVDGEGSYGGPAGAQALAYQMQIYGADQYFYANRAYRDCRKVLDLAKRMAQNYGSMMKPCWEGCESYGDFAAIVVDHCLKGDAYSAQLQDEAMEYFVQQPGLNVFRRQWIDYLRGQVPNYPDGIKYLKDKAEKFKGSIYSNESNQTARYFSIEALETAIEVLSKNKSPDTEILGIKEQAGEYLRTLPETLPVFARTYLLQKYRAYLKQGEYKSGNLYDFSASTTVNIHVRVADPKAMSLLEISTQTISYAQLTSPNVDVKEDLEGNIWIATWGGIKVFNKSGALIRILPGRAPLVGDPKRKRMWINFSYYDFKTGELKNVEMAEPSVYGGSTFRSFMHNGEVYTVDTRGVFKYDDARNRWVRIYRTDKACNMAAIRDGKMYIARSDGLFEVGDQKESEKQLYIGQVWDVVLAGKKMLIASAKGFYAYEPDGAKLTDMNEVLPYKSSEGIRKIIINGNLAFLATGNMHYLIDMDTNKNIDIRGTGDPAYYVWDALFSSNKIWTAGANDVKTYDFPSQEWKDFGKIVYTLPFQSTSDGKLLFHDNAVWAVDSYSIERFDVRNHLIDDISLSGDYRYVTFAAGLGKYVATRNYLYDTEKKLLKKITMTDGLPAVNISAAASDEKELWFACYDEEAGSEGDYRRFNPAIAIFDKQTGGLIKSFSIETPINKIIITIKIL